MYWMTGSEGDVTSETVPANGFRDLQTIFDRLEAKGVSWKIYIQAYSPAVTYRAKGITSAQVIRAPVLAMARFIDDRRLASHIVPLDEYYTDLAQGTLPAVSYVVPAGSSEHPPARVATGQAFIRNMITALKRSSAWPTSAFMWSYSNWGGWYDHVAPPSVDRYGLGFRVPALLVSPYAKRGYVDTTQLDHTSMLKFVENNWGLQPLSSRDARSNDLTTAFDWNQQPRPPQLLASESPSPIQVHGKRAIIYPAYGAVALFALFLLALAVAPWRRRHEREART
jgi:phospholipase C